MAKSDEVIAKEYDEVMAKYRDITIPQYKFRKLQLDPFNEMTKGNSWITLRHKRQSVLNKVQDWVILAISFYRFIVEFRR